MGFEAITGPNWIVPTPPAGDNSNRVADTAFVAAAIASTTLPTTQTLTNGSSAVYTTAVGARWLEIYMVGGGGGGGGATSGATGAIVAGGNGGDTIFNGIHAAGGLGAGSTSVANVIVVGTGGTGGTGSANRRQAGENGSNGSIASVTSVATGGRGGSSVLGQGAVTNAGTIPQAGGSAAANTGGGGGGANGGTSTNVVGPGGGGGEFAYLIINNPAANYTYTIGAGGTAGVGLQVVGGTGGSGVIFVVEHYI